MKVRLFFCKRILSPAPTPGSQYIQIVAREKVIMMFHVQLLRCKNKPASYNAAQMLDQKEGEILSDLWNEYLGFDGNTDLTLRYFDIVRDKFYTRVSLQNLTFEFVHDLLTDAKKIVLQMAERDPTLQAGGTN